MSEVLKCELNVPSEIALKFPDGINVQSQYGMKVLYTLVDERKFFAPPFLADKIKNLKIGPGERFSICKKTGLGNKVQWEIKRVAPPASGPELAAPAHSQTGTVGASQNTQHSNGNRQETLTQLGNVLVNGVRNLKEWKRNETRSGLPNDWPITILPPTTDRRDRSSPRCRKVRAGHEQAGHLHFRRHPGFRDLLFHPAA